MCSSQHSVQLPPQKIVDDYLRRLWIGNIDVKVSEFDFLSVISVYGNIERLDFRYGRDNNNRIVPKGFCFVTYTDVEIAIEARKKLDGYLVGRWRIKAQFANQIRNESTKKRPQVNFFNGQLTDTRSHDIKIKEIEAKLNSMK